MASRGNRPELIRLPTFRDARGSLTVAEGGGLPFEAQRAFWVYDSARPRGGHGHEICEQFLVAVRGSARVKVRYEDGGAAFAMVQPDVGLYIPAGVWLEYELQSPDSVLLVLCSEPYDPDEYL